MFHSLSNVNRLWGRVYITYALGSLAQFPCSNWAAAPLVAFSLALNEVPSLSSGCGPSAPSFRATARLMHSLLGSLISNRFLLKCFSETEDCCKHVGHGSAYFPLLHSESRCWLMECSASALCAAALNMGFVVPAGNCMLFPFGVTDGKRSCCLA